MDIEIQEDLIWAGFKTVASFSQYCDFLLPLPHKSSSPGGATIFPTYQ